MFACLGIRQSAQAGYIVTLQQVGPNVVATGSGAINLTGLTFFDRRRRIQIPRYSQALGSRLAGALSRGRLLPAWTFTSSHVDRRVSGAVAQRLPAVAAATWSGYSRYVFTYIFPRVLIVPRGYVSGTFLSNSATYSGKTIATLGVTPGTYVWTWGTGANQNFTLQIPPPPRLTGPPGRHHQSRNLDRKLFSQPERLGESARIDHRRVFSIWNNERLRTHYRPPQSQHWEHLAKMSVRNSRGLTASTTYHLRIVTANSAGTRYGSDETFTTLPPTGFPIVTTKPATNVAASAATLNGLLDPHGLTTSVYIPDMAQLRPVTDAHHGCAEPHWKHLSEYCCQHRCPGWQYYYHCRIVAIPTVDRSYQSYGNWTWII